MYVSNAEAQIKADKAGKGLLAIAGLTQHTYSIASTAIAVNDNKHEVQAYAKIEAEGKRVQDMYATGIDENYEKITDPIPREERVKAFEEHMKAFIENEINPNYNSRVTKKLKEGKFAVYMEGAKSNINTTALLQIKQENEEMGASELSQLETADDIGAIARARGFGLPTDSVESEESAGLSFSDPARGVEQEDIATPIVEKNKEYNKADDFGKRVMLYREVLQEQHPNNPELVEQKIQEALPRLIDAQIGRDVKANWENNLEQMKINPDTGKVDESIDPLKNLDFAEAGKVVKEQMLKSTYGGNELNTAQKALVDAQVLAFEKEAMNNRIAQLNILADTRFHPVMNELETRLVKYTEEQVLASANAAGLDDNLAYGVVQSYVDKARGYRTQERSDAYFDAVIAEDEEGQNKALADMVKNKDWNTEELYSIKAKGESMSYTEEEKRINLELGYGTDIKRGVFSTEMQNMEAGNVTTMEQVNDILAKIKPNITRGQYEAYKQAFFDRDSEGAFTEAKRNERGIDAVTNLSSEKFLSEEEIGNVLSSKGVTDPKIKESLIAENKAREFKRIDKRMSDALITNDQETFSNALKDGLEKGVLSATDVAQMQNNSAIITKTAEEIKMDKEAGFAQLFSNSEIYQPVIDRIKSGEINTNADLEKTLEDPEFKKNVTRDTYNTIKDIFATRQNNNKLEDAENLNAANDAMSELRLDPKSFGKDDVVKVFKGLFGEQGYKKYGGLINQYAEEGNARQRKELETKIFKAAQENDVAAIKELLKGKTDETVFNPEYLNSLMEKARSYGSRATQLEIDKYEGYGEADNVESSKTVLSGINDGSITTNEQFQKAMKDNRSGMTRETANNLQALFNIKQSNENAVEKDFLEGINEKIGVWIRDKKVFTKEDVMALYGDKADKYGMQISEYSNIGEGVQRQEFENGVFKAAKENDFASIENYFKTRTDENIYSPAYLDSVMEKARDMGSRSTQLAIDQLQGYAKSDDPKSYEKVLADMDSVTTDTQMQKLLEDNRSGMTRDTANALGKIFDIKKANEDSVEKELLDSVSKQVGRWVAGGMEFNLTQVQELFGDKANEYGFLARQYADIGDNTHKKNLDNDFFSAKTDEEIASARKNAEESGLFSNEEMLDMQGKREAQIAKEVQDQKNMAFSKYEEAINSMRYSEKSFGKAEVDAEFAKTGLKPEEYTDYLLRDISRGEEITARNNLPFDNDVAVAKALTGLQFDAKDAAEVRGLTLSFKDGKPVLVYKKDVEVPVKITTGENGEKIYSSQFVHEAGDSDGDSTLTEEELYAQALQNTASSQTGTIQGTMSTSATKEAQTYVEILKAQQDKRGTVGEPSVESQLIENWLLTNTLGMSKQQIKVAANDFFNANNIGTEQLEKLYQKLDGDIYEILQGPKVMEARKAMDAEIKSEFPKNPSFAITVNNIADEYITRAIGELLPREDGSYDDAEIADIIKRGKQQGLHNYLSNNEQSIENLLTKENATTIWKHTYSVPLGEKSDFGIYLAERSEGKNSYLESNTINSYITKTLDKFPPFVSKSQSKKTREDNALMTLEDLAQQYDYKMVGETAEEKIENMMDDNKTLGNLILTTAIEVMARNDIREEFMSSYPGAKVNTLSINGTLGVQDTSGKNPVNYMYDVVQGGTKGTWVATDEYGRVREASKLIDGGIDNSTSALIQGMKIDIALNDFYKRDQTELAKIYVPKLAELQNKYNLQEQQKARLAGNPMPPMKKYTLDFKKVGNTIDVLVKWENKSLGR